MKFTRRLITACALALLVAFPVTAFLCGTERWPVKVCKDAKAKVLFQDDKISTHKLKPAVETTIEQMIDFEAPAHLGITTPRFAEEPEDKIYTLEATLFDYKWEKPTKKKNKKTGKVSIVGDDDYHLAIKDESGNTMIAEIASKSCVGQTPEPLKTMMKEARDEFDAHLTATSRFKPANLRIRITGPGFFDKLHGQRGLAPNGIEIHPILKIEFLD